MQEKIQYRDLVMDYIRRFTKTVEKRRDVNWNRPVTVDYFNKDILELVIKKITYLKLLSNDFFEISSLEAKEEELEIFRINVGNFLSECILQRYGWIEQQKLQMDFRLPEEDVFLETNEHYLRRMIENLFSNIRKYVGSYVGMKMICEKEQLMIVLENDLKEIDVFDTNRVFEPFYRGNARSNEGSGLGLYVVKCLAKQLGYEVSAECQDGLFRIKVIMKRL